jgi:hypothetical protein
VLFSLIIDPHTAIVDLISSLALLKGAHNPNVASLRQRQDRTLDWDSVEAALAGNNREN